MKTEVRTELDKDESGNTIEVKVIGVYDEATGTRETYYSHECQVLIEDIGSELATPLIIEAGW